MMRCNDLHYTRTRNSKAVLDLQHSESEGLPERADTKQGEAWGVWLGALSRCHFCSPFSSCAPHVIRVMSWTASGSIHGRMDGEVQLVRADVAQQQVGSRAFIRLHVKRSGWNT